MNNKKKLSLEDFENVSGGVVEGIYKYAENQKEDYIREMVSAGWSEEQANKNWDIKRS